MKRHLTDWQKRNAAANCAYLRGNRTLDQFAAVIGLPVEKSELIRHLEAGRSFGTAGEKVSALAKVTPEEFYRVRIAPDTFEHSYNRGRKARLKKAQPKMGMNPVTVKPLPKTLAARLEFEGDSDTHTATLNGVRVHITGCKGKRVEVSIH